MAEDSHPPSLPLKTWHIALCFAIAGVAIYLDHRYAGPYRWFAELQLRWIGAYDSTITYLLTCTFIGAPIFALAYLFRRLGNRARAPGQSAAASRIPPDWTAFLVQYGVALSIAALGAFLLALAAWYYADSREHARTRVLANVFEANHPPESKWVSVQGISLFDSAAEMQKGGNTTYYIPLVSLDWKERDPVAVIIAAREFELTDSLRRGRWDWYDGTFSDALLPSIIENELSSKGATLTPHYFVLDLAASPADNRRTARDLAIFGVIVLAGGLTVMAITRRREILRRRVAPAVPIPTTGRDPRFTIKAVVTAATSPPPPK